MANFVPEGLIESVNKLDFLDLSSMLKVKHEKMEIEPLCLLAGATCMCHPIRFINDHDSKESTTIYVEENVEQGNRVVRLKMSNRKRDWQQK